MVKLAEDLFREGLRMLMVPGATEFAKAPEGSRPIGEPIWVTVDRYCEISQRSVRPLMELRLPADELKNVNAYTLSKTSEGEENYTRKLQFYKAPSSFFHVPVLNPVDCFPVHLFDRY